MASKQTKKNGKNTPAKNTRGANKTRQSWVVYVAVFVALAALLLLLYVRSMAPAKPAEPANQGGSSTGQLLDDALTYYADIEIQGYGTVTVELDQSAAPITAANFVKLAQSGFYDGLTFHRIINGTLMQGGAPEGTGYGGAEETIVGEFSDNGHNNPLSHTRGAISMARSKSYDSASSQFFIVQNDYKSWDGQYAVFGYVVEGMDVVDAVCADANPVDSMGMIAAEEQPVMTSVTIRTE